MLAARERFAASADAETARLALHDHLARVIGTLEPRTLGTYWPMRCEFNPIDAARDAGRPLALPFCTRAPRQMSYRMWDGAAPRARDECGIAASDGSEVVPDVVLAPCLGYTRGGWRVGYGGGYFDRFLAAHPHVTAVGVAWSVSEVDAGDYAPESHDRPMMLIVTERGVA